MDSLRRCAVHARSLSGPDAEHHRELTQPSCQPYDQPLADGTLLWRPPSSPETLTESGMKMSSRNNWRYCQKCQALYDGETELFGGRKCQAGGVHEPQGYNFFLPSDSFPGKKVPQTASAQTGWVECTKCAAMFWSGYSQKGSCSYGGEHAYDPAGAVYTLTHDVAASSLSQNQWRFCEKCYAMFYDGYPTKGACPSGGGHAAQGFMFDLPHDIATTLHYDFNSITFPEGTAAGGNAHLVVNSDGSYEFSGHFHDSGAVGYKTACVLALEDSQKNVYTFTHQSSVGGTFTSGSRDDNWDVRGTYPTMAAAWPYLAVQSNCHEKSQANIDVGALLDSLLKGLAYVVKALSVVSNQGGGGGGAQSDPDAGD
jgi:hypothetical protein